MKCFPVLFLCYFLCCVWSYKPVVLMHGILDCKHLFYSDMKRLIAEAHPGTNVTTIDKFSTFFSSFTPLWTEIDSIRPKVEQIMKEHPEGVHLLCFSQGGLVCRGLLHTIANHNCQSFIALSSPLVGQYGDTSYLKYLFPSVLKPELYRVFYTDWLQKEFSVANYWNDPHHQDLYRKYSNFLAVINNQTDNPLSEEYKNNFLRIRKLVCIGGPDDGVITPWQSSQFGFYDQDEKVKPYSEQEWYIKDSFGLRSLVERNDFHTYTVPGVAHTHWHTDKSVFTKYILPYLD